MPTYLLKTPRLGFRSWSDEDLLPFSAVNQDSRVMEHFPAILSIEESSKLIERLRKHQEDFGFTMFAADELTTGKFIGFIGLKWANFDADFTPSIEIGWRLGYDFWGKGYATEGAQKMLQVGFSEFGIKEIYSFTTTKNWRSERVMSTIGMKKVGEFDHVLVEKPEMKRHVLYQIKQEEFDS